MQDFENKYDLLNAAYQDDNLRKGAISLLQYLVHKSNKEQCFPAVETIAKALGCCIRTVQYNMRKLERAGYIIRKDRYYNHQQLSNQYVFNFGIKETGKTEQMKFSDEEYEQLNSFSFNSGDNAACIRKINQIQKIYSMTLNTREKLLLIYLYHRANKKGICYDLPSKIMDAVGVRTRTFKRLLYSLRKKGLLKIKSVIINNLEYLVLKLTGKEYQDSVPEPELKDNMPNDTEMELNRKFEQLVQEGQASVSDHKAIFEKTMQFSQDIQETSGEKIMNSVQKWKLNKYRLQDNLIRIFQNVYRHYRKQIHTLICKISGFLHL